MSWIEKGQIDVREKVNKSVCLCIFFSDIEYLN